MWCRSRGRKSASRRCENPLIHGLEHGRIRTPDPSSQDSGIVTPSRSDYAKPSIIVIRSIRLDDILDSILWLFVGPGLHHFINKQCHPFHQQRLHVEGISMDWTSRYRRFDVDLAPQLDLARDGATHETSRWCRAS